MKFWKETIPDPLQTVIPTNEALTIKEWIDLIQVEHRYCVVPPRPESPVKPPVVSIVPEDDSMPSQLDALLNALTDTDEDSTTEVVVYQTNPRHAVGERVELQELSEFDPYKLTCIEVQKPNSGLQSSNSFSVQVLLQFYFYIIIFL